MCNCNRLKRSPTTFSCVSTFSLPRPFLKPFLGSRHLFSQPFLATLRNVTKPYETFETLRNLTKRLKPFKTFQNLSKPFKTFPLQNLSTQHHFSSTLASFSRCLHRLGHLLILDRQEGAPKPLQNSHPSWCCTGLTSTRVRRQRSTRARSSHGEAERARQAPRCADWSLESAWHGDDASSVGRVL